MLNSIEAQLKQEPFRDLCQWNEQFAKGVLHQLCGSSLCLFAPSKANRFSQMAFKFPLDTDEEFLECVLDCVELLGEEPAKLSIASEDADGYILGIRNSRVIDKTLQMNTSNPWCLAGLIFTDFNKDKKQDNNITIITSDLFKKEDFFLQISKYSYIIL